MAQGQKELDAALDSLEAEDAAVVTALQNQSAAIASLTAAVNAGATGPDLTAEVTRVQAAHDALAAAVAAATLPPATPPTA